MGVVEIDEEYLALKEVGKTKTAKSKLKRDVKEAYE